MDNDTYQGQQRLMVTFKVPLLFHVFQIDMRHGCCAFDGRELHHPLETYEYLTRFTHQTCQSRHPIDSSKMSGDSTAPIMNLPIELVYRILNHLDPLEIMLSASGVCTKLDQIIDTYQPYQVRFITSIDLLHYLARQEREVKIQSMSETASVA